MESSTNNQLKTTPADAASSGQLGINSAIGSSAVNANNEEEDVSWVYETDDEDEADGQKNAADTSIVILGKGDELKVPKRERFPDEISGISAESEEHSDKEQERDIEPTRLYATLENLATTQKSGGGGADGASSSGKDMSESASGATAYAEIPTTLYQPATTTNEETTRFALPVESAKKEEEADSGVEKWLEANSNAASVNGQKLEATANEVVEKPTRIGNGAEKPNADAEEVEEGWTMIPVEEFKAAPESGSGKTEVKEAETKKTESGTDSRKDSAIQFSFKAASGADEVPPEAAKNKGEGVDNATADEDADTANDISEAAASIQLSLTSDRKGGDAAKPQEVRRGSLPKSEGSVVSGGGGAIETLPPSIPADVASNKGEAVFSPEDASRVPVDVSPVLPETSLPETSAVPATDVVASAAPVSADAAITASSTISSSDTSGSSQQKGVRFVDSKEGEQISATSSLSKEDLAQLEEYEAKMRRRSKEALELVDRICGLQGPEESGEKRPPIVKPSTTPTIPSTGSSSSSSSNLPPGNSGQQIGESASSKDERQQLKEALAAGVHGLAGGATMSGSRAAKRADQQQREEKPIQMDGGPVLDVECLSVNASVLQCPSDCLMLPGNLLLIVDSDAGLTLISLGDKQVQLQLAPKTGVWRNPECACVGGPDGQDVFVLLEYNVNSSNNNNQSEEQQQQQSQKQQKEQQQNGEADARNGENSGEAVQKDAVGTKADGPNAVDPQQHQHTMGPQKPQRKGILKGGDGGKADAAAAKSNEPDWRRFVCRFSVTDFTMQDRIEAPKWLRERVVWQCRLCFVPQTQCLYLMANTPNQGFLFELKCPEGRWAECVGTRRHSQYADLHHFASVGPVTELLLVETNRLYVQLISVYNSSVVSSRNLGICERPGALCVDDHGNLLIFDRATSTVGLFSRAYMEKIADLAIVERAHCTLSARQGILAILCRPMKELKLHRYADRLAQIEQMLMGGGGGGVNGQQQQKIVYNDE